MEVFTKQNYILATDKIHPHRLHTPIEELAKNLMK